MTGGARGIGLASALALRDGGHRVAVTYRSSPPEVAAEAGLLAVRCDVTDAADVEAAFEVVEETLGPVEILVSNAGITRDNLLLRMSEEDFAAVLDTNLTGGYRMLRRSVRSMMRARWGRIILVSSVVGLGGQAVYDAAQNMLEWLREDYDIKPQDMYIRMSCDPAFRVRTYQMVRAMTIEHVVGAEYPKERLTAAF